jgi:hypothetical protein
MSGSPLWFVEPIGSICFVFGLCFFLAGMASKSCSFGVRFFGRPSLSSPFSLLVLRSSAGLLGTRAS